MTRRPAFAFLSVALVACMPLLAACGGDDDGGGPTVSPTDSQIDVEAHDVKFNVGTIEAKPGSLDGTLLQKGNLDHTFVVEDSDGQTIDPKLLVTADTDDDSGSYDLQAGDYEFYCDIPGHRDQGMEGKIVVE